MKESKEKLYLDHVEHIGEIDRKLTANGWIKNSMGKSYQIDYNYRFNLYFRKRKLSELFKNISQEELQPVMEEKTEISQKSLVYSPATKVSKEPMGYPKSYMTPVIGSEEELPQLSGFGKIPSLAAIRTNKRSVVIAFDSEWYYEDDDPGRRQILTWQFATVYDGYLLEFVFLRKMFKFQLNLELALGRILDTLDLPCYDIAKVMKWCSLGDVCPHNGKPEETMYLTRMEAEKNSKFRYEDGKTVHAKMDWQDTEHVSVTLLCHAGKADISALDQSGEKHRNVLKYCSEVQGGLVTLQPVHFYPSSVNPRCIRNKQIRIYPISLQIADTMCHAPAGMKSLKALGETVKCPKIQLEEGVIEKMDHFLVEDPVSYFEYASNDSIVTLMYASALYGFHHMIPVTITSASSTVLRLIMASYLRVKNGKEFDRKYRGLETVKHGLVPRKDRPGYIESTSKEPISDKANTIQHYASHAYHGGYNSCSDVGYFPFETYDYDLQNAYPTAMCLVSDVDWENPIQAEIINRDLTLHDFTLPLVGGYNPVIMLFAYVRFEFPETVKYPCIPVNVDGIPIYPGTSDGIDGVYACGPELYLALRLGAKIFCEKGFILNSIINPGTGELSYCLRAAVKQLVEDRNRAKIECGKKSIEELILKTMVNSGYGKNAQNVIQKNRWTARTDEMLDLGASSITNPVSACMITSIVRATLIAAQNQCHELGYMTCSVTTDGFISDIPESKLKSLDLMGIRKYMEQARIYLSGNPELWEIKHHQNDLLNFTTRGNVSLQEHGVCAHNSTKTGYPPDSYEDRLCLYQGVVSRTDTVDYDSYEWTTFKDLVRGQPFVVRKVTKHIRMDFDMKRKPDRNSFEEKIVEMPDGEKYEIANFTTVPFENITEFKEYRQKKKLTKCLRTMEEWKLFFCKLDVKGCGMRIRDLDWAILFSCVIGHRAGHWNIKKLDVLKGQKRCDFLNAHNDSKRKFKIDDWKNAGRNERQASLLPREMIEEKLRELMEA